MPAQILLCINQNEILEPYIFSLTNIKVYSFEEALYHSYHYWQESFEDFLSEKFLYWVKNILGQKQLAKDINALSKIEGASDRFMGFLSLTEYFDRAQLAVLQVELKAWEQQLEWERLKDMGDHLIKRNEPEKAYQYYKKALRYGENIKVLNNLGICLMYLENYGEAATYLKKAYEKDKSDFDILINYAEALILSGDFEGAFKYLKKAERDGEKDIVFYLYGRLCYKNKNYSEAVNYYQKALELGYNENYYYNIAKAYIQLRKYNEALEVIEAIKKKDAEYYINQGQIHGAFGDYGAAVKCVEKAIVHGYKDNCALWTILAKYHRLNYDLFKAEGAITKALNINANDKHALLEQARIKKGQGKTKDYQLILSDVLNYIKKDYRKPSKI